MLHHSLLTKKASCLIGQVMSYSPKQGRGTSLPLYLRSQGLDAQLLQHKLMSQLWNIIKSRPMDKEYLLDIAENACRANHAELLVSLFRYLFRAISDTRAQHSGPGHLWTSTGFLSTSVSSASC